MTKHPANHLERIKLKYKKDAKRKKLPPKEGGGDYGWREEARDRRVRRIKEELKARETEDELQRALSYSDE